MRLLVEFSHPAQVHKFKHVLRELIATGSEVRVLSRNKDVMVELLEAEEIPHVCISRAGRGIAGMAVELLCRELSTLWQFIVFRPTMVLAAHSVAITHIGWLFRVPRVVHDDTEHAGLQQSLYMPFATHIITTTAYMKDWGRRQIRINSLEPLAYLHPDRFEADSALPARYRLDPNAGYAVVRLIAWQALHDRDLKGDDPSVWEVFIRTLLEDRDTRIVLTSESDFPMRSSRLVKVRPWDFHHVLAPAKLCVTEGGSVAIEAAALGVPTVFVNTLRCGHIEELKRYGLIEQYDSIAEAGPRALELWGDEHAVATWQERRASLLSDKVEMSGAIVEVLRRVETATDR